MANQNEDERVVRDLDDRWNRVYIENDRAPFAEILADDIRLTWPDGRSELGKAKMMEPTPKRRVEFSERGFEIHGATAVTRGRIRVYHPEGPAEQRFVRVYVKSDGRWQAVSVHVFPIDPAADAKVPVTWSPPRIETERLVLTWPSLEQIRGHHDAIVGTDMFDTIVWAGPEGPADREGFWAEAKRRNPAQTELDLDFAVIERASDRCVGGVSLRPIDGEPTTIDIGYAFAPTCHGQGIATEGVGALIGHAFAERGAERISASIFVGNDASKRVVEKLGFKHEGTLRRAVLKRGTWIDEWLYAITRPDWEG